MRDRFSEALHLCTGSVVIGSCVHEYQCVAVCRSVSRKDRDMIRRFLALALLVVTLASPPQAVAGPLEDGVTAYQRGDYATALHFLRPLAEQGHAAAQLHLGGMYWNGDGVAQDYAQAVAWFRKSAEQGNASAQFNLGDLHEEGLGVPQDYVQAVSWYRKSAEQGNARAQFNLGVMYENGQGVPQDYVQAHMWINLAASRETDLNWRNTRVKARDTLAAKMTREQIAEAQRRAREWKPRGK